jgi:hypothetical protein
VSALAQIRMENPARKRRGRKNVGELLIFGNPKKRGFGNHRAGCPCKFCKRAADLQSGKVKPPKSHRKKRNSKKTDAQRGARERASRIRAARLNPKKKQKRATPRRRRTDRNPSETTQAVKLFQGFHGHDPKGVVEKQISAAVRLDYTALGPLLYVKSKSPMGEKLDWDFRSDGVTLASSPDGKQLYCIGGNQNILPLLDDRSKEKDLIDLGDALEVAYLARKVHGDFRPIEYYHAFGEINGSRPRLCFSKLRKELFFIGGDYFIDVNMRAPGTPLGKVSPGIEN